MEGKGEVQKICEFIEHLGKSPPDIKHVLKADPLLEGDLLQEYNEKIFQYMSEEKQTLIETVAAALKDDPVQSAKITQKSRVKSGIELIDYFRTWKILSNWLFECE